MDNQHHTARAAAKAEATEATEAAEAVGVMENVAILQREYDRLVEHGRDQIQMLEHQSDDQVLAQKLSDACTGKLTAELKLKDRMIESLKDDIQKQRNGAVAELCKQQDQHEATIATLQDRLRHKQLELDWSFSSNELTDWTAAIKATTQETLLDQQAEIVALTDQLQRLNHSPGPRSHSESPKGVSWSPRSPAGSNRSRSLTVVDEPLAATRRQVKRLQDQLDQQKAKLLKVAETTGAAAVAAVVAATAEQLAKQAEHYEVLGQTVIWSKQECKSANDSIAELTKEVERQKDTIVEFKKTDIVLAETVIRNKQELKSANDLIAVLTQEVERQKEALDTQQYEMALELIDLQARITDFQENDLVIETVVASATAKLEERDAQHTKMCVLAGKAQTTIERLETQLVHQSVQIAELKEAKETSDAIVLATSASDAAYVQLVLDLKYELQRAYDTITGLEDRLETPTVVTTQPTVPASSVSATTESQLAALNRRLHKLNKYWQVLYRGRSIIINLLIIKRAPR